MVRINQYKDTFGRDVIDWKFRKSRWEWDSLSLIFSELNGKEIMIVADNTGRYGYLTPNELVESVKKAMRERCKR